MLKSYEAVYEEGQLKWLSEPPAVRSARVIVTVVEEVDASPTAKRRSFPGPMAGRVEVFGDIVSPIVNEEDWECLK